jgi:hypothetical protein
VEAARYASMAEKKAPERPVSGRLAAVSGVSRPFSGCLWATVTRLVKTTARASAASVLRVDRFPQQLVEPGRVIIASAMHSSPRSERCDAARALVPGGRGTGCP